MKKDKIGGLEIEYYDSIEELPAWRFQKMNKALLVDAGVGADLQAIDTKIARITMHLKAGRQKEAEVELLNMRQAFSLILSEISPKHLAFAALVMSINGKPCEGRTDEDLQAVAHRLKEGKQSQIERLLGDTAKKLEAELKAFFPKSFDSAKEAEAYDTMKARTRAILRSIGTGEDVSAELVKLDDFLLSMHSTRAFTGSSNPEAEYDRNYVATCAVIGAEFTQGSPKDLTVVEFYACLDLIKARRTTAQTKGNGGKPTTL